MRMKTLPFVTGISTSREVADEMAATGSDRFFIVDDNIVSQPAKVRELSLFMDIHLELVARMLYAQAFFGGKVSDGVIAKARGQLEKNIAAFKRLARFAPYVAGDTFTLADCTAVAHLPLVAMSTKLVCGEDLLAAQGVDWKGYVKRIEQRPTAQKVAADRKADQQRAAQLAALGNAPA